MNHSVTGNTVLTQVIKQYDTNLYNEVDERQIRSYCNAEEEIKNSRLHTAMATLS